MKIDYFRLHQIWQNYWSKRNHKEVPPISLIPKDDPTTLFTGSGMQQLIPFLMGEVHPLGKRLFNIQPCFRFGDIEEIGDNRHQTFFEMMGNWSLGDYFKEEQLPWVFNFFTKEIELPLNRLYVSVFAGNKDVPRDEESALIWKKLGIPEERIFYYDVEKNWWSRSGEPSKMPPGEIGGPDSEVFFDFGADLKIHERSPFRDQKCHPNCQCGRFLEIGNSVFIQYQKEKDGSLRELPQKNVDYGGGLERLLAVVNNEPDIFKTEIFFPIIKKTEEILNIKYNQESHQRNLRIIADHLKSAVFLINEGVLPSNKEHGYVLRRLLRRAAVKTFRLVGHSGLTLLPEIATSVIEIYRKTYLKNSNESWIKKIIKEELSRFQQTLARGLREIEKKEKIDGKTAFDLYQSYGFPFEITQELLAEKGLAIDKEEFKKAMEEHKKLSRKASIGMFKGGLADHQEKTIKYHTATHLLHQALRDVFGEKVRQQGSNINAERLRFDFNLPKEPTEEELKKVEAIVNEKIKARLPVVFKIMKKKEAEKLGALSFFKERYPDEVKVYFIGATQNNLDQAYSKEFCGGPHVNNTGEIGSFKIIKFKRIGSNLFRIYGR